jgi:caffeoyl-CoA O-methyltransferase
MSSVVHQEKARPVTPLGILVEHLETAVRMMEADGSVPSSIAAHVKQAWRLAAGIDPYLEECTTQESKALGAIAKNSGGSLE